MPSGEIWGGNGPAAGALIGLSRAFGLCPMPQAPPSAPRPLALGPGPWALRTKNKLAQHSTSNEQRNNERAKDEGARSWCA
jgi:hypothetical protein